MSKLVEDVKTSVKGIRGAGDAIRGELLDATDHAFGNNQNHPKTQATQSKHRAVAEKGKQDLRNVDDMFARREWERKGVSTEGAGVVSTHQSTATSDLGAPASTESGNQVKRAV
ncbi:hypothetical protein F4781DRAFT_414867 [Annulohypoxylon bovei var. microspora]|nr:hypothetical protein F4781DRAFT_414867 [Annulohypoxylon bovei var. microspora]